MFLHNLLNVLEQIANKMGLQKNLEKSSGSGLESQEYSRRNPSR
jgi:hypothetical protein